MAVEVTAHITGTVWRVEKAVGDAVEEGEVIVILESMKMEVPVEAPAAGRIAELLCRQGDPVAEDEVLAVLD